MVFVFLNLALWLEATGICAAAWFLALIQRKICGFQFDEVYVGTAEERAAKGHADDTDANANLDVATNVPAHAVGAEKITKEYMDLVEQNFTNQREKVMANIADIRAQIEAASSDEEKKVFEDAMKLEVAALKTLNENHSNSIRDLNKMMDGESAEIQA